jgi:hypothetical protein
LNGDETSCQPPLTGSDLRSAEDRSGVSSDRPAQLRSAGDLHLIDIKPDYNKKQTINPKLPAI